MTKREIINIQDEIVKRLDMFDNGKASANDTLDILMFYRKQIQEVIKKNDYDNLLMIPTLLYSTDMTIASILQDEAQTIDDAVGNKISLKNVDLTWKKEE